MVHHKHLFIGIFNFEVTFNSYPTFKILFFSKNKESNMSVFHNSNIYQTNKLIKINICLLHHNCF
jgi:hypothetical protein